MAAIIHGYVLLGLKKAQLTHAFGGDAARREVGDATGIKFHANIRNIYLAGKNRQTDGTNFFDWGSDEREHDVQVVDHKI